MKGFPSLCYNVFHCHQPSSQYFGGSYKPTDKEKRAAVTQGALILNVVDYLEQTLSVLSALAKDIILRLVFDVEFQLQDELC